MKKVILLIVAMTAMSAFSQSLATNANELKASIKDRYQKDLSYLKSGGKLACEYNCAEVSFSSCVRVFSEENGEIQFKTYRRNFNDFSDDNKVSDILGKQLEHDHLNGSLSSNEIDAYLEGSDNLGIQVEAREFDGVGEIAIHWVQTPYGTTPLSADIPYGANFITNKSWCVAE